MKTVFLSHRIDFLSVSNAVATAERYKNALRGAGFGLVSMAYGREEETVVKLSDKQIVEKCLNALVDCDAVVFDCSEENWTYIGCVFEVVYAFNRGMPIFACVGETSHGRRPWLRYHCEGIYLGQADVAEALRYYFSGT